MSKENKGFLYEEKINSDLKKYKLQSLSFSPAKSNPNAPDAEITYNKKDYKIEVKLDLDVDFGQGSLDYDLQKNKWILGGAKTASAEQMREFLTSIKVPQIVQKEWGKHGAPRRFTVPLKFFKKSDVDYDYKKFTNKFINIPKTAVANYYDSKQTYYIQIGGYGLYYMTKDIANLGVPELDLQLKLRIRLKRGGSNPIYNYRFTTAIIAEKNSLSKSKYNLDDVDFLKALKTRDK